MIRIFRKSWRRSKRTVCAALCLVFLSSLLAVPAGAESFSGSLDFSYNLWQNDSYVGFKSLRYSFPVDGNFNGVSAVSTTQTIPIVFALRPEIISLSPSTASPVTGSLGLYFSWYFYSDFECPVVSPSIVDYSSSARLYLSDGSYESVSTGSLTFNSFGVPHVDGHSESIGISLKGRIPSADTFIDLSYLRVVLESNGVEYEFPKPSGIPGAVYLVCPSVAFVSGVSSSDLDALEGIADGIAAQSQILSSMYGDIMELLNDLYARLGDMQAVEELTNTYFAQLIPLVNSINTNTANIYSLLQTQFQLLRTLIATASGDIQAAIENQTDDLIAYFDTVFSGATGDMPEKSDDLQSSVGDFSDAESGYQSNATQRFEELASTFSGFSGGTLAGVTLASTLFTRVWNALGQYNIVYYFPLLLGLSLVIIGRLPRGSGGQSSSEKHRGDSSA